LSHGQAIADSKQGMQAEAEGGSAPVGEEAAKAAKAPLPPEVRSFLDTIERPDTALLQPTSQIIVRPLSPATPDNPPTNRLKLNLDDPTLLIQMLPNTGSMASAFLHGCRCLLAPAPSCAALTSSANAMIPEDKIALEFVRFNISNNAQYRKQRRGRVAGMASGASMLHSPIATNLSQLPLPCNITASMLLRPHHPIHTFVPSPIPCASSPALIIRCSKCLCPVNLDASPHVALSVIATCILLQSGHTTC
jgi:hypothetical protein